MGTGKQAPQKRQIRASTTDSRFAPSSCDFENSRVEKNEYYIKSASEPLWSHN